MLRTPPELPTTLRQELDRAGYYPELVADLIATSVAGEQILAHFVHVETTFDHDVVRRHITTFVATPTRLVVTHADDHAPSGPDGPPHSYATAAVEAVPLSAVRSVVLNHVIPRPEAYRLGTGSRDLTLTLGWGAVSRLDLEPAQCADPDCEADHGYTGTASADDISVRVSADADGQPALEAALAFAQALSAAIANRSALG